MKQKLLILGGNALSCDIVQAAKSLGVYTIVTDWYDTKTSPAKLVADEYWNISTTDYQTLSEKIEEKGITGVLTGFSDSYLLPYQHLCELNGLPCYATKEQFEWTLDKATFKSKCKQYGVPVVPEYELKDFDPKQISETNRIIIKPVDNSGSRGICLCEKPEDFQKMLTISLDFSEKKQVVIERYMDCDDVSFEYTIQDGEVMLSAICDRYIYKTNEAGSVTSKLIYPSKYLSDHLADTDKKVRQMFKKEGLRNGVLFMQAFVEDGKFYFYEMGYRLSGGRHYIFTEHENDRSAVKELIRFAVTGSMSDEQLGRRINPDYNDVCCQLSIICKTDIISKIEGWQKLASMPEVIDALLTHKEGDEVGKQGTTASITARLHVVAKSMEDLKRIEEKVYSTLKVRNAKGENLVIRS